MVQAVGVVMVSAKAAKLRARQRLGGEIDGCEKPKPPPLIL